jgi:hypothetical protein
MAAGRSGQRAEKYGNGQQFSARCPLPKKNGGRRISLRETGLVIVFLLLNNAAVLHQLRSSKH